MLTQYVTGELLLQAETTENFSLIELLETCVILHLSKSVLGVLYYRKRLEKSSQRASISVFWLLIYDGASSI